MSAPWLINKPASPSIWDDEFESTTLDPAWTLIAPAGGSIDVTNATLDPYANFTTGAVRASLHRSRPSWLMYQPPDFATTTSFIMNKSIAGAPSEYFMIARGCSNQRLANTADVDGEWGVFIGTSTLSSYFLLMMDSATTTRNTLCARSVSGVFTAITTQGSSLGEVHPIEYFGIQCIGTTYHGWAAPASGNWSYRGSFNFGVTFDHIGFRGGNSIITSPGLMIAGMDFIRIIPGRGPF